MAGPLDEDDGFWDDDDLDHLGDNQLAELEHHAVLSTQHHTQAAPYTGAGPSSNYGDDDFEDDELDDAEVWDETKDAPPKATSTDLQLSDSVTQREQFREARYGSSSNINHISVLPTTGTVKRQIPVYPPNVQYVPQSLRQVLQTPAPEHNRAPEVEALQRRVEELLRKQEVYKEELNAKTGEIAIVRSKQEKAAKEYERELSTIKKLNTERAANQQRAIEAAREAEKTIATELEFTKKDLSEEAEKLKTLRRAKGPEVPVNQQNLTTPKKLKTAIHRDGFDDDEVQVVSPSKFRGRRSNGSTPTKAGHKRKRKAQESPAGALDIEHEESLEDKAILPDSGFGDVATLEHLRLPDDRLEFLESVLAYQPFGSPLKAFETLAHFALPSSDNQSFASFVISKLPALNQSASDFPVELCELFIDLWSKCLAEKFYKPIQLLTSLLTFCIELKTLIIAPFVMDSLLPVAQSTADLVAIPRFKREPYDQFKTDIDASACLELMYLVAQGCMAHQDHSARFWRLVRIDFVLMMLSPHQPIPDFALMLQLLAMSATKDSTGPRAIDQETQRKQVTFILDRMSLILVMRPTSQSDRASPEDHSIVKHLRYQTLRTFQAFCQSQWGGESIALHRLSVGRLFKFMSDELDSMYDYRADHKLSARLVNLATRILHHLLTRHESQIDLAQKLAIVHGSNQKHLLSLARLYFMDDSLLLEAGIEPEVSEYAHEMLELSVTPEEGEAIHAAYSGG